MKLKYTEDQTIESTQSVILWSKPRVACKNDASRVLVQCGYCKSIRPIQAPTGRIRHNFTGLCKNCVNKYISKSGSKHHNWKGGKLVSKDGYIYLHISLIPEDEHVLVRPMLNNADYVLEHRLIMARQINRSLHVKEIVHHMNGVKNDNRPENLMLCSNSSHKKEELRIIDKLKARIRELEAQVSSLSQ